MRAVTVTEPGGPEVLTVVELPDLSPGAGEVLVEVAATAVNRADLLQRMGVYPPPPGASQVIGLECSGTISAVGDDVTLTVTDNGRGLAEGAVESGLANIRRRAENRGGAFTIESAPGEGTTIRWAVPR